MNAKVKDSFEITNRLAAPSYPPGLVVVLDWQGNDDTLPVVGDQIEFLRQDGGRYLGTLGEIKCHGAGRSFYLAGAKRHDVPIGSAVSWPRRSVGPRTMDGLGRLLVVKAEPSAVSSASKQ